MPRKAKNIESKLVDDGQEALEAAIRTIESAKSIPEGMRDRVRGALKIQAALSKNPLNILKSRFESHPERHKGVEWAEVKKALAKNPEKLASLQMMEKTGRKPDILDASGDSFVFGDFSFESTKCCRDLTYYQAADRASEFGVELMDEFQYRRLQELGAFDMDSESWLKTPKEDLESGYAFSGRRYDSGAHFRRYSVRHHSGFGFRCALRVQKAK